MIYVTWLSDMILQYSLKKMYNDILIKIEKVCTIVSEKDGDSDCNITWKYENYWIIFYLCMTVAPYKESAIQ